MSFLEKINVLNRINIDDLTNTFLGMERRMQIVTGIGAAFALLLIIFLPMLLVTSMLNQKESEYQSYMESVADFYTVAGEYAALTNKIGSMQDGGAAGSKKISDVIYDFAEKSGIPANSIKLNPNTQTLKTGDTFTEVGQDGKIIGASFEAVLKLLDQIDKYPGGVIKMRRLEMKVDAKNKSMLREVGFTISQVKSNKEKEGGNE